MKKIIQRIHRVQGQLNGLEEIIAKQHVCEDVIPQLLAVKGSVDSLVKAYLETSLEHCVHGKDPEAMKRVMSLLIARS